MRSKRRADGDETILAAVAGALCILSVSVGITLVLRAVLSPPFGSWEKTADLLSMPNDRRLRVQSYMDIGIAIVGALALGWLLPTFRQTTAFRQFIDHVLTESWNGSSLGSSLSSSTRASAPNADAEDDLSSAINETIESYAAIHRNVVTRVPVLCAVISGTALVDVILEASGYHVYVAFASAWEPFALTSTLSTVVSRTMVLVSFVFPSGNFYASTHPYTHREAEKVFGASARRMIVPFAASTVFSLVHVFSPLVLVSSQSLGWRMACTVVYGLSFLGRMCADACLVAPCVRRMWLQAKFRHHAQVVLDKGGHVDSRREQHTLPFEDRFRSPLARAVLKSMSLSTHVFGLDAVNGVDSPVPKVWMGEPMTSAHMFAAARGITVERLDPMLVKTYLFLAFADAAYVFVTVFPSMVPVLSSALGVTLMRCLVTTGAPLYKATSAGPILMGTNVALLRALQRHEASLRSHQQQVFLGYVCHEVRVPLNTVALSLSEIDGSLSDATQSLTSIEHAETRELLARVHSAIRGVTAGMGLATASMKHVLDDVLLLQKMRSGAFELQPESFHLVDMIDRVVTTFRPQATHDGVHLVKDIKILAGLPVPAIVHADPHRLSQVCANFLSNALKFTPRGRTVSVHASLSRSPYFARKVEGIPVIRGMPPSLSAPAHPRTPPAVLTPSSEPSWSGSSTKVSARAGDSQLHSEQLVFRYIVSDQGVGMTPVDLHSIFRPFTQVKSGKNQAGNGTGLGLVICRQIIALHGGRVGCWSEGEGLGSTFWFDVPVELGAIDSSRDGSGSELFTNPSDPSLATRTREPLNIKVNGRERGHTSGDLSMVPATSRSSLLQTPPTQAIPMRKGRIHLPPIRGQTESMLRRVAKGQHRIGDHASHDAGLHPIPPSQLSSSGTSQCSSSSARRESRLAGPATRAVQTSHTTRGELDSTSFPFAGLRILVVDDTRPNAVLLARMAQRLGAAHVDTAGDGLEGLRAMGVTVESADAVSDAVAPPAWRHDLVLMDKEMPVMDGHEAARAMRRLGFDRPVVGVSGNALGADRAAFVSAGADDVLDKPVAKAELVRIVEQQLEART